MWWKRLLGRSKSKAEVPPDAAEATNEAAQAAWERACDRTQADRDAYWSACGSVDTDFLTHLISPQLLGGPAWPTTRQAYRVIRKEDRMILASDGLSDPFENDHGGNGFGMEVYLEIAGATQATQEEIMHSPWFQLVAAAAQNIAAHGDIGPLLEHMGLLSMEVPLGQELAPGWASAAQHQGVLIGMGHATRPARTEGGIRMAALTPLRPDETAWVATSTEARDEMAKHLSGSTGLVFDADRPAITSYMQ